LLALTLVLQMFSVRVYGRGSVSVAAIGVLTSVFLLDTGTAMSVAVVAALAQWIRRRGELHKGIFDCANFALSAAAASIVFHSAGVWRPGAAVLAGAAYAAVDHGLLCRAHRDTIAALSRSMEAKDVYTGGHTERVAAVAVALARKLGYHGEELEAVEIGALLHDIGKIGIPEQILRKQAPLDDGEWDV